MNDKLRFNMVIFGMICVLGLMFSGHFKFLPGLIIFILPFIWMILKFHKVEYGNIPTDNKIIKILLISKIAASFIALLFCFLFLIDAMYEITTVSYILPIILLVVSTINFLLDLMMKKLIKRDSAK